MDEISETRDYTLVRSLVTDWFYLALEELEPMIVGRFSADVSPARIYVGTVLKTESGNQQAVSISLSPRDDGPHHLAVTLEDIAPGGGGSVNHVLRSSNRRAREKFYAVMSMASAHVEADSTIQHKVLSKTVASFDAALRRVEKDCRRSFVVSSCFTTDISWPDGTWVSGPYRSGLIREEEGWRDCTVLLSRDCLGYTATSCKDQWHDNMISTSIALSILFERDIRLTTNVFPDTVTERLKVANFHPAVEEENDSKFASFFATLEAARIESPYGGSSDRPNFVPDDVPAILAGMEELPADERGVLSDALSAYQVGVEQMNQMPSLALGAFMTSLERLVDWDPAIKKSGEACSCCKLSLPRSRDAIVEFMTAILALEPEHQQEVTSVLRDAQRLVRNPWTHRGQLAGLDLTSRPEVWTPADNKKPPAWAQMAYILENVKDFAAKLLCCILVTLSIPAESNSGPVS